MKKVAILLSIILIVSTLSGMALAVDPVMHGGFYNIESKTGVTITPYAGKVAVTATNKDVDGDEVADTWYRDSDRLEVSCNVSSNEGYYSVMLVEGNAIPTKDSAIFYIDQVSPENNVVNFNVYPILPDETTDLTLYIASNVESFDLLSIKLSYAAEVPEDPYTLGDIDNNGEYDAIDALTVLQISADLYEATEAEKAAANVNGDDSIDTIDALMILQYGAGLIDSWN